MNRDSSQAIGALLILMPVLGLLLFGLGTYFVATDRAALGASMFAVGASQFAIVAALRAKAKADTEGRR